MNMHVASYAAEMHRRDKIDPLLVADMLTLERKQSSLCTGHILRIEAEIMRATLPY